MGVTEAAYQDLHSVINAVRPSQPTWSNSTGVLFSSSFAAAFDPVMEFGSITLQTFLRVLSTVDENGQ